MLEEMKKHSKSLIVIVLAALVALAGPVRGRIQAAGQQQDRFALEQ